MRTQNSSSKYEDSICVSWRAGFLCVTVTVQVINESEKGGSVGGSGGVLRQVQPTKQQDGRHAVLSNEHAVAASIKGLQPTETRTTTTQTLAILTSASTFSSIVAFPMFG